MSTDLIKGHDPHNSPDFFRLPGVKDDFSGVTPIPDGQSLQSPVSFVGEYQYFISQIAADQPCTITYEWFADKTGTTLLDSVAYNYLTSQGVRIISNSTLSDYLRVTISNTSGVDMTMFNHKLKLSPTPVATGTGGDASTATISQVALNATTSTTIKAASTNFVAVHISNESTVDIWVKFQAASIDNGKKGIFLERGGYYEMPTGQRYTGEISAIADSGTPTINVTVY